MRARLYERIPAKELTNEDIPPILGVEALLQLSNWYALRKASGERDRCGDLAEASAGEEAPDCASDCACGSGSGGQP